MEPFGLVVLVATGAAAYGLAHLVRRAPRPDDEWEEAARRLGARFTAPTRERGDVVQGHVDGTSFILEHLFIHGASDEEMCTRVRVAVRDLGFELGFQRAGLAAAFGTWLGSPDVAIGDPRFDATMAVRSNRPHLARAWLAGDAREPVQRDVGTRFSVANGEAVARVDYHLRQAHALVALVREAVTFARGGDAWRTRWQDAALAMGAEPSSKQAFELVVPQGLVSIAVLDQHAGTRVTLSPPRGEPASTTLDTIEPDVDAWRAAIARLVAAAEGSSAAPYR
jgi:hypothetical protein